MPYVPSNKILIVLLFWEGDKAQAMKLARLLADLEPKHSEYADLLFVSRFDCPQDMQTVAYCAKKFNVHTYTSHHKGVGWPLGCNCIFFSAIQHISRQLSIGKLPGYKAIFVVGPDGAPLKKNWVERLSASWGDENNIRKFYIGGAMVPDGNRQHINGDCAMLSGDLKFLAWLAREGARSMHAPGGWDWVLASDFKRWGWRNFPFIKSLWNRTAPFTEPDWAAEPNTVWIHGQKGDTLLDLSRKKLL